MVSFKKKTPKIEELASSASSSPSSFPSSIERTVASALLLLSDSPPKEQSINCYSSQESYESWKLISPNSSGGSISPDRDRDSFVSPVVFKQRLLDELKLKVVRKKRTRTIWVSNEKISTPIKTKPICAPTLSDCVSEITTADNLSSLSCTSSIQSCYDVTNDRDKQMKLAIPGHIGNQVKAILGVLSNEQASEVRIRQLLGDSPTISKALRVLLRQEKVKRCGAGGRCDPYIYMMA